MPQATFCKNCGGEIVGEAPDTAPDQRRLCPRCGSLARRFEVEISGGLSLGGSATFTTLTFPAALLATARRLFGEGEFSIAVVVAHMACEVSAERAVSRAFAARGATDLEDAVEAFLPGYSLANTRVRDLYNALTSGQIQSRPFWQAFTESATRRNQAVHRGRVVTQAEAEASLRAAAELITFLSWDGPTRTGAIHRSRAAVGIQLTSSAPRAHPSGAPGGKRGRLITGRRRGGGRDLTRVPPHAPTDPT